MEFGIHLVRLALLVVLGHLFSPHLSHFFPPLFDRLHSPSGIIRSIARWFVESVTGVTERGGGSMSLVDNYQAERATLTVGHGDT